MPTTSEPDLILHYPLRTDAASNQSALTAAVGPDLQMVGGAPDSVANHKGEASGAVQFRGGGSLVAPAPAGLPLGQQVRTLCFWAQFANAGEYPNIDAVGYGSDVAVSFQTISGFRVLHPWGHARTPDDKWHHYTIVVSGAAVVGYVDGNQVFSIEFCPYDTVAGSFFINRSGTTAWAIEDVRVYSRALTQQAVLRLIAT
ncbi:MAG TPA: hypothetical protein PLA94_31755, partial [Myxococcota bacterium]|nr:hypothetical protein [Myxococcota bacterium]